MERRRVLGIPLEVVEEMEANKEENEGNEVCEVCVLYEVLPPSDLARSR